MSRTLLTKLRRDGRRQWPQFTAILVIIVVGVALFGSSYDAYRSLDASYRSLFDRLVFADVWATTTRPDVLTEALRADDGVALVATRRQAEVALRVGRSRLEGRVVGVPMGAQPAINRLHLQRGRLPSRANEVVAERHLASAFDLRLGATLSVATTTGSVRVRVVGVATSAEYLWLAKSNQEVLPTPRDFGVVFAPDRSVAAWAGGAAAIQVLVRTRDPGMADAVARRAEAAGASSAVTRAEQPSNAVLQQDVEGFGELALLFAVLFLSAAGLGAWILLTRLVLGQRAIIGMLGANGVRRRTIFAHYAAFGLLAGVAGGLVGAGLGVVLAGRIADLYTRVIGIPKTVLVAGGTTFLFGVAFAVVTGVLAAVLPAWRAVRVAPAEAMRGGGPRGTGRRSTIERLLPPARRLPASTRYVVRGAGRDRRRTLTTVAGVMLSLSLILVSLAFLDTVDILLDRQFGSIAHDDAQVLLAPGRERDTVEALRRTDGVADVEVTREVPVVLQSGLRRYPTLLIAYPRATRMRSFPGSRGELALPSGAGLLAGVQARSLLGVGKDDRLKVRVAGSDVELTATVAGLVDEPMGTFAYTSVEGFATLLTQAGLESGAAAAVARVRYRDGVDRSALELRLEAIDGVQAVTDSRRVVELIEDFFGFLVVFVGVMLVLGALLAFALIFNAMSVNIAERTVELATLRAAGVRRRRIARLVTFENLSVSALGIGPGLVVAYALVQVFFRAYETDQFRFTPHLHWWSPVLAAAAILVVTAISQVPGLRAVRRVDIAAVVRERAG